MSTQRALAILVLLCLPAAARAQEDRGATVSGAISATNMDSRTSLSFSGAFGYRFSRVVGLELEVTVVPTLKSQFPGSDSFAALNASTAIGSLIYPYPTPRFMNAGGRAVIFSNNVRIAVPTTSTRLEPYFVAGGGMASIRHTAEYSYPVFASVLGAPILIGIPPVNIVPQRVTSTAIELALTLGGGLSVRVASQVSVDADLRMFRLMGVEDRNAGRFGVGVRYRF